MKITALIPAAGRGERIGLGREKQFIELAGKPVLAHTLATFHRSSRIDDIVLVVPEDHLEDCRTSIVARYRFQKVISIVPGGRSRQESVCLGLEAVSSQCSIVVIHDGVRPFVSVEVIERVIDEALRHQAVIVAVPAVDTLKRVSGKRVKETLNRQGVWQVQTPQAFKYPLILEAHRRARDEGFRGTDDSSLVERMGVQVMVSEGSSTNIKITTPEDLALAEAMCRENPL